MSFMLKTRSLRNLFLLMFISGGAAPAWGASFYVANTADFQITIDNNAPGLDAGDIVTWNLAGNKHPQGTVTNLTFGTNAFDTIQNAITAASDGDTIYVQAGTYVENPTVNKQLVLQGANVGLAGSGVRLEESIVLTSGNQNAVISITKSNVTVDGFFIDGDDPLVSGSTLFSGDDANANYGIRPTSNFSNLTIQNNIIRHVFVGFRGDGSSGGSVITNNWFDSIGNFDFGYAVSLRTGFYADATNNLMTRVWTGVHSNSFFVAAASGSWQIKGNVIHSYAAGIFSNMNSGTATGMTIDSNQITAEAGAVSNNFGILMTSVQAAVNPTITQNTIIGTNYGVGLFDVSTTSTVTLAAGNTILNTTLAGVLLTDNLNFNPIGTTTFGPGADSTVNLAGLTIAGASGACVKADATNGTISKFVVSGGTSIDGSGTGAVVTGAKARIDFSGAAPTASFSGTLSKYIDLQNAGGTNPATEIDATNVQFAGKYGSVMTLSELFGTEDRLVHAINDASLGFVRVSANKEYVTASKNVIHGAIQRAINLSAIGHNIYVAAGAFNESVNVSKSVTLFGAQANVDALQRLTNNTLGSGLESVLDGGSSASPVLSLIAAGATVDGFVIRNGTGDSVGIAAQSTFQNNDVRGTAGANAIYVNASQVTVAKNLINKGSGGSACGVLLDISAQQATLTANNISNTTVAGIKLSGNNSNSSISNNLILANTGSAIVVSGAVSTGIVVSQNALLPFGQSGIKDDSGAINATQNFWDDPTGPFEATLNATGTGSTVSGTAAAMVSYSPWLGDGSDTDSAIGFQPNLSPLYGLPAKVAFLTSPGPLNLVNQPFFAQPLVEAQDASGNRAFSFNGVIALSPSSASLIGTTSLNAVNGRVAFTNVGIDTVGSNYTLQASSSGLTNGTSSAFDVLTSLPTTTSIVNAAPNPSRFGQSITFTATEAAPAATGLPAGTVEFREGGSSGTLIGTASLANMAGVMTASFSTSSFTTGTHGNIVATYLGDASYDPSSSPTPLSQVVNKADTSVAVNSNMSALAVGQGVDLTATVTVTAPGAGVPTSSTNVQFRDGGSPLGASVPLVNGQAVLNNTVFTTAGSHIITLTYGGDANFNSSTSPNFTQVVSKANTFVTVNSSLNAPVVGQAIDLTATVFVFAPGAGVPTSSTNVQFLDGGNPIGAAVPLVNGQAVLSSAVFPTAGSHTITLTYGGDANFNGSTSPNFTQAVNKANTSVAVSSNVSTPVVGQAVQLTATVTAIAPGAGTPTSSTNVQFLDGGSPIGAPVPLVNGQAVLSNYVFTTPGSHAITLAYGGDANFNGSTSLAFALTLSDAPPVFASAPTATPNPVTVTQSVAFVAAVTDVNNELLSYSWAFGDGSSGSGASTTHTYALAGTYTATVSVSDGINPPVNDTVTVTVNATAAITGAGPDSDADGFSDAFEMAVGSDPNNTASTPTGQAASVSDIQPLTIKKAAIALNFKKTGNDTITFNGTVAIPAGFNPSGARMLFAAGGVTNSLTLGANGSVKSGGDSVKIRISAKKGVVAAQSSPYAVSFTKGNFTAALADSGLTNATEKQKPVSVTFTFILNGTVLQTVQSLHYTATKGSKGMAK